MYPRTFLNKLKWHPDFVFEDYAVVYLHRGAPKDEKYISCREIVRLEGGFFIFQDRRFGETYIPYHRIKRILDKEGNVAWEKPGGRFK
jgi:hypothetical protein